MPYLYLLLLFYSKFHKFYSTYKRRKDSIETEDEDDIK